MSNFSNFKVEYEASDNGGEGEYIIVEGGGIVRERCRTHSYISAVNILAALRCCERRYANKRYTECYNGAGDDCAIAHKEGVLNRSLNNCRYCNQSFDPAGAQGWL